jgi:hypothetical protein
MVLRRQEHRLRNLHSDARREPGVEKFVVGDPPERIVDHPRSVERGELQERLVTRHLVRDAIYEHVIGRWLFGAGRGHLGVANRNAHVAPGDFLDERVRKRSLTPNQKPDLRGTAHGYQPKREPT